MTELRNMCIRFDWAINSLLRQKANFGVLEGFLTMFIGEPMSIIKVIEGDHSDEINNYNLVSIMAQNAKDEISLIEIQNIREAIYIEHTLYGTPKAIAEHRNLWKLYRDVVKKVYSISILYFDLGKGEDYLYHGQNHFIGVHTRDSLEITRKEQDALVGRKPEDIFPEYILIRVNEFNKVAVTPMEEWMAYLKNGVIRPDTSAPGLSEARAKLQYYSMSEAERRAYDEHLNAIVIHDDVINTAKREGRWEGREEGLAEGRAEGHAEGLAEGRAEGHAEGRAEGRAEGAKTEKIEIAKRMKSMGMEIADICQLTNLPEDQIRLL